MKQINKILFGLLICIIPTLFVNAAAERISWDTAQGRVCMDNGNGGSSCSTWTNTPFTYNTTQGPVNWVLFRVKRSDGWFSDESYVINYGYQVVPDAIAVQETYIQFENSDNREEMSCTGFYLNSSNYYRNECNFSPLGNHEGSEYLIIRIKFYVGYVNSMRPSILGYYVREGQSAIITQQTDKIIQEQEKTTEAINDLNDSLNDDDTTDATNDASDFFSGFSETDHGGLSAIITAPLTLIQSLTDSTCSQLVLPLPFLDNKNITLPCLSEIYSEYFGTFFSIYQTIIFAIISYGCLRSLFFDIKGFTNPDDDRIEVMDL